MIPLVKKLVNAFLWDELAAVRWLRGGLMMFAMGGVAFADGLAAVIEAPGAVKAIKLTALACVFVGGAITAGEKNPKPEE